MTVYFSDAELACKCCGVVKLAGGFKEVLIELRIAFGYPMIVTSCCRCRKHNEAINGAKKSFHQFDAPELTGLNGTCAIDIDTVKMGSAKAWELAALAMDRKWSVGIARTFLHLDRRADYKETTWPNPILFTY